MKIATYNVNGVNGRLPVLLRWLEEDQPDIVCLQELKAPDEKFPEKSIRDLGYDAIWHGQKSWNGVAILSRVGEIHETRRGLPGDASTFVNKNFAETLGGGNSATPSPVSARLTVNGVTENFDGNWFGYALLQNGLGTYIGSDGIGNQVNDYVNDGLIYRNSYLVSSIYSSVNKFIDSTDFSTPLDYTFQPGDTMESSEFQIQTFDYSDFTFQSAQGHLASQRVTIASVPEPMTWTMMLGGFGLVGLTIRRRGLGTISFGQSAADGWDAAWQLSGVIERDSCRSQ